VCCNVLQKHRDKTRISRMLIDRVVQCCSVLQYVAACCTMLQYVAVCSTVLHYFVLCCSVLQRVAVCCRGVVTNPAPAARSSSVLQRVALCCIVLQCVAVCCNVLQCAVLCCSVLQSSRDMTRTCSLLNEPVVPMFYQNAAHSQFCTQL